MKFLCERCKTRYSIGDDRVRGKILKIRCKNCANVITVREGMGDAAGADAEPRRTRNTTQAPSVVEQQPRSAKPPAALEEEWYVSIDGEQEGPFSLVDAQRWVAQKAFDADLHCWSEGFDDWLPVDKVSHFRGLRKRPAAAAAPPPIPRAATAAGGLRASTPVSEVTPKPLFAATMASLEKSAAASPTPAVGGAANLGLPSLNTPTRPSATPPGGERAIKAKGPSGDSDRVVAKPAASTPAPAKPESTSKPKPEPKPEPKPKASATPTAKVDAKPAVKTVAKPAAKTDAKTNGKPAGARDVFDANDQATQIDSTPFDDSLPTVAKIIETTGATNPVGAAMRAQSEVTDANDHRGASDDDDFPSTPRNEGADDDDDDLSIGEVSRVVNLADLMAGGRAKTQGAAPAPRRSSPALGNAAAIAKLSATGAVARIEDPNAPTATPDAAAADHVDHAIAPAVQETHRRGLIALIGVAVVLLAGVIFAVIMLVGGGSDSLTNLGRGGGIDTTRPDDPLRPGGTNGPGSASAPVNPYLPPKPIYRPKNPTNPIPNNPVDTPLPGGDRIGGDEVETMARAQQATTQRCYMRAQRGAEAITVGEIKKLNVTLEIAPDGLVRSVGLDKASDSGLGKCLIGAIKLWKFRTSPGGTYRFALVFAST